MLLHNAGKNRLPVAVKFSDEAFGKLNLKHSAAASDIMGQVRISHKYNYV